MGIRTIDENGKVKWIRNPLKIGQVVYIMGWSSSSVEVVGDTEEDYVLVKILTTGDSSKFKSKIGQNVHISRSILYPRGDRIPRKDQRGK